LNENHFSSVENFFLPQQQKQRRLFSRTAANMMKFFPTAAIYEVLIEMSLRLLKPFAHPSPRASDNEH
jgi:hypothetical protein